MKLSGVFRVLACVVWIGGLIAGIVLSMPDGKVLIWPMIAYWCGFGLLGLFLTAIGAHLENQETIISLLRRQTSGEANSDNETVGE